ncbi:MAG: LysR family transcriptional regulator [Rhizobacter sp.]|nr:LysR family transcriptional regulator [Rhizobacter sp.]
MDVNLRHARAFVTVAHLRSFTKAAEALHLSQPALTVQIRNFETALKIRVFDRSSRSVELTRMGRELLPMLERTLHELDVIVADTHAVSAGRTGVVRIASLPSFAASLLPEVISATRHAEPGLSFVVRDAVASRVVDLVRESEVDLGLTGGEVPPDGVEVLHRAHDQLCVVFPRNHALAGHRAVRLKHLSDVPLVLTDQATSVRAVVESAFARGKLQPRVVCETTYMMTAAAMVSCGLGVTILPGSAREREAFSNLSSRPIEDEAFVRPISLVKKQRRTLSPACNAFADACIEGLEGGLHVAPR